LFSLARLNVRAPLLFGTVLAEMDRSVSCVLKCRISVCSHRFEPTSNSIAYREVMRVCCVYFHQAAHDRTGHRIA
jgi:hypothetical protein